MAPFDFASSPTVVIDEIAESQRQSWPKLGAPGTWWTGEQRLAIAARSRLGFAQRDQPPWSRDMPESDPVLSDDALAIVDRITLDAGSIDAEWAAAAIGQLGEGAYVEVAGIIAVVTMVDMHAVAVGADLEPLPVAQDGEPTGGRPDDLADIGGHVAMTDPFPAANVARALSSVPAANKLFRAVMGPMYSGSGFIELKWSTPLTRPQVELVASRVAAMNECFY